MGRGEIAKHRDHNVAMHTLYTHTLAAMWLLIIHIRNGHVSLPSHVNTPASGFIPT